MPLGNVTYGTMINSIASTITNSCVNLNTTKYNALPTSIKGGTAVDNVYGKDDYRPHIKIIASNGVSNLTGRNIANDIKDYIVSGTSTKLKDIYPDDENITMPKFISFFNNIVSFCVGSMEFVNGNVGGVSASGATIYGDTYLSYKSNIDNTYKYDIQPDVLVRAKTVNDVIEILRTVLNRNIRCRAVTLSWDLGNV